MTSKLYPFQKEGVRFIRRRGMRALVGDDMGLGKAQPVSAKVLTPFGWKRIGRIKVGDQVIGANGKPTLVTGVFDQGELPVMKLTFRDGSSTRCCNEHLWAVQSSTQKMRGQGWKVKRLKDVLQEGLIDAAGNAKHYIPLTSPVRFNETSLPLDPYLIGYLIANGGLTVPYRVGVSIPDKETVRRVERLLPKKCKLSGKDGLNYQVAGKVKRLRKMLERLGLYGRYSHQKSIPRTYFFTGVKNRKKLLQGLMDGDGYADNNGCVQYTTTSKRLARQIRHLVWSLGGTCTERPGQGRYKLDTGEWKECRRFWVLTLALPDGVRAFKLTRKQEREENGRKKYKPTRALVKVENAGTERCVCIRVAAPDSLYLTDDYIVTHNTIQSLFACWMYLPADRPIVVLCPASLKEHWRREASMHVGMRADILEHRKPPAHFNAARTDRVFIINQEILGSGYSSVKTWCKVLRQMKPAAVVIDEAHLYTNPTAKRTKNMYSLCGGVRCVIALTGTPTDNTPNKLFPIAHLLKPKIFPSYNHFCYRYCKVEQTPWGPKFVGTRRPKELNRLLKKHLMIRRKFEDVFSQLPKMTRTVVPLKLPPKAQREYDLAEKDFIRWLRKKYPTGRKATRAERAERMVKFGYLMRLVAELKRPLVEDWVRNFLAATKFKLVVFGVHKSMIRHGLHPKFKGSYLIDGGVHPTRRQEVVDRFVAGKDNSRPLFGNLKAAGTGWSAKGVPFVAMTEFGLNPADLKQAERRVQGIGRGVKNMASVAYYLPVRGTIEEKILKIVQTKQKNADAVLDGKTTRGLEVADLLHQALLKKGGLL